MTNHLIHNSGAYQVHSEFGGILAIITRADGASICLQGDDASKFLDTLALAEKATAWPFVDLFNQLCSDYDHCMTTGATEHEFIF